MTTPQTKFSINSVKKTNTINGIEFNEKADELARKYIESNI